MFSWKLSRQGYATDFMVSGPKVTPYESQERDKNQLRYEARLRQIVPRHIPVENAGEIRGKEKSRLGLPWRFQGGRDGEFVNLSDFYAEMRRVEFDAATVLLSPRAMAVPAVLWSYAAVDVYCNGALAGTLASAVYKPIGRREITLPLKAGKNVIYLACETLGVRDTRSVVGLQIMENREEIRVTLPNEELSDQVGEALAFIESAYLTPGALAFSMLAPQGAEWAYREESPDYARVHDPIYWQSAAGKREIPLRDGEALVLLRVPAGDGFICRALERTEQIKPRYLRPVPGKDENLRLIFERIARVESLSRGEDFGFPIANILARKYLGDTSKDDDALLKETFSLIERRVDCADFLMCGLIRYMKNYPLSPENEALARHALTHFRYWMDQDGFDGMCFWSENHCLMFYASAMQAGSMYPEEFFPLARMTGRELSAWGRGKVLDWMNDVEKDGFEEFLSTVYTCVTFAALINVVDYSEEEISQRARKVTDGMLRMLAKHTFHGGVIAPQGRVYRGVLYPFRAGAMALMNAADPSLPYEFGEGWLGFFCTSSYRFPEDLKEWMDRTISESYVTGNARIVLEKQKDYCLTSVQCPREPFDRWENIVKRPDADPSGHAFVKSYNECFHGTTCFQPGVYGYQQHLWYAALDGEAAVFINHPGSSSEGGDMRPGYWHGNGVFPALRQEGPLLGLIYKIPENYPIHFIHLYCPACRFDEIRREGNWLLLRKGRGYIGIWSSEGMEPWNSRNFDCELRMWGSDTACLCLCAGREVPSMDAFWEKASALAPAYDPAKGLLTCRDFALLYTPGRDDTQYL